MPRRGTPTDENGVGAEYPGGVPAAVQGRLCLVPLSPKKEPGLDATRTPTWALGNGEPA